MCVFELQLVNLHEELVIKYQVVRLSSMASESSLKDSFQSYKTLCVHICLCVAKQLNKINVLNGKKRLEKITFQTNINKYLPTLYLRASVPLGT